MEKLTSDKKDEVFVETLVKAGINRKDASVLVYLALTGEAWGHEIEIGTGLRQCEVSILMRRMKDQGLVEMRKIKRERHGAPRNYYKLATSMDDIITTMEKRFEKREEKRAAKHIDTINKLREMSLELRRASVPKGDV